MTSFVNANGLRFAYEEEGKGKLVLLVHGFPDTPHTWDRTIKELAAAGFRAVAPFTRGYAPTEIPKDGDYSGDTLGRDLIALIEALGEKSAIVVGHDWGASASYSAATLAPEKVEKLVTIAIPHPASIKPSLSLAWTMRHFVDFKLPGAVARARKNDFALIDELVKRWSPAWDVPKSETDAVKACFREPGALDAALGYYRAIGIGLPASQRKKISVPTISFAGLHDNIAPEAYDAASRRFTGPYRVVRMPGGHFMHREHPDVFVKELLATLAENAS
jgi:pimeloyl-ACP methyl ester carboxylesterase